MKPGDPPKWGLERWYHHAIPVLLGLIILAVAIWLTWDTFFKNPKGG